MQVKNKHRPCVLIILDGWGYCESFEGNAIAQAHTPIWNSLWKNYPHRLISGSGKAVGLPEGQMGNSEVGHLNMGAGRLVYQELGRINESIENKSFYKNLVFIRAIDRAVQNGRAIHILGLLSDGGVHSHESHIYALMELASTRGAQKIYIHPFLDGRDTPPKSAGSFLSRLEKRCFQFKTPKISSISGRYYAMDRDQRWDRTEKVYELLTEGKAFFSADTAEQALASAYARGETDEFVKPTRIGQSVVIQDQDVVFFMNFRADRARQLSEALAEPHFNSLARKKFPKLNPFVTLTEYKNNIQSEVAYPPVELKNTLGEYISNLGLNQLRIAETEKYAHVTFFFNGGREAVFSGEDRLLIPSPNVATYDLKPEMSAFELTDKLVEAIGSKKYDLIICNYANADMVGHTGKLEATIQAIEAIDTCLGRVIPALKKIGGEALITADHGNAEKMFDFKTAQVHTAHTTEPVPLVYVGRPAKFVLTPGALSHLAPTLLTVMGLPRPLEMTQSSLIELI